MKNINELYKLIDERFALEYDNPMIRDKYREEMVEYFTSEDEVEEFIKNGDYDYVYAIGEAYEAITEKFPSDRLEYLFHKFVLPSYPNGVPTGPPKYDASLDDWPQ